MFIFLPKLPGSIFFMDDRCRWSVSKYFRQGWSAALRKPLDNRMQMYISGDTFFDLAELVLKNNIFKFSKKN